MPRLDGTGPVGYGPMTGGGFGRCAGYETPYRGVGRAGGRGHGCRRTYGQAGMTGWERRSYAMPAEDEKTFLGKEAEILESRLKDVRERIASLDEKSE